MENSKKETKEKESTKKDSRKRRSGRRTRTDNNNKRDNKSNSKNSYNDKTKSQQESKVNDASWYATSQELLRDSASFSWLTATGTPWSLDVSNTEAATVLNDQVAPGIMTLSLIPTPGKASSAVSPVNVAARNIYAWVRHANAGHANYDSQDLMLYLLAMDEVYMFYAHLVRIYGLAKAYSQYNRYYPKALVEALDVDFEDVIANLAQLRYGINSFGAKIGSFAIPASMPYFARHQWMYSGVYVDSPSYKAQSYMYKPVGYRTYEEKDGAGYLKFHQLLGHLTVDQLLEYADGLMNKVALSEDCNIMSGDILKAFGIDKIYKIAPIPEDYMVLPAYVPEVLSQIQNATVNFAMSASQTAGLWDITQNPTTGDILFDPAAAITGAGLGQDSIYYGNRLVNMYKDEVTPADTMVATRLTNILTVGNDSKARFDSLGSEVCVRCNIYKLDPATGETKTEILGYYYPVSPQNFAAAGRTATDLSAFDFHPMVVQHFDAYDKSGNAKPMVLRLFQLNNYVTLSKLDLRKMDDTALLSMFAVPQVGVSMGSR